MSTIHNSTAGAVELASGKWVPVVALMGTEWRRLGDAEYDTGDEAMSLAWECVNSFAEFMGAAVLYRGVETYTPCPDGKLPKPQRFAPELN